MQKVIVIAVGAVLCAMAFFYGTKTGYDLGMRDGATLENASRAVRLKSWLTLIDDNQPALLRWSLESEQDTLLWQTTQENDFWLSSDPGANAEAMHEIVENAKKIVAAYRLEHPRDTGNSLGVKFRGVPLPAIHTEVDKMLQPYARPSAQPPAQP